MICVPCSGCFTGWDVGALGGKPIWDWHFTAIAWTASARAGRSTPAKQGLRGGSRLDAHEGFIIGMIEEAKDITLNEMVLRLREKRALLIGHSALDVWLQKRGRTQIRPHMHLSRSVPTS